MENYSSLSSLKSALYDVAYHSLPNISYNSGSISKWIDSYGILNDNVITVYEKMIKVVEMYK